MAPKAVEVGPLEMQILGVLENEAPLAVSDVQKKVGRSLAYTTVMTVLSRLYEKGHVQRQKQGRQYLYSPSKGASSDIGEKILAKVGKTLFKREKFKPIMALLDDETDLSKQELMELKKIINKKLNKKGRK